MAKNETQTTPEKSVLPQMLSSQDMQTVNNLKSATEDMLRMRQETTKQLGEVTKITGHVASIAESSAKIRQSDNNVLVMSQQIAAKKEMFHEFLEKTFDRRDKSIDKFIELIDKGVNENDTETLLKAMDALATIVAQSPWPNFEALNKMIDAGDEIVFR
jgi:biopolymer transport protein ExbB/TolQ